MATVIRAWRVENDRLRELAELPPGEQGLIEDKLEDWLASEPDAIQDNLLMIGRQVNTGSGPLDLLALTIDGKAVVIELKRDRAPRETVAQALDYGSWIAAQTPEEIRAIAANYLKRPLEDAFLERFGQQLPEIEVSTPGILVVASRLDASTERMIQYLSQQYEMDIDGLIFRYLRLPNQEEILVRTSVVSEERRIMSGEGRRVTPEMLIAHARERNAVQLLLALRKLGEFLWEESAPTYGGSFRYWGPERMLCGVNAVGNWGAPPGAIDVWVSYGSWAQFTGIPEETIVEDLRSGSEFVKQYEGSHQIILRIGSQDQAELFVGLLRRWFEGKRSETERTAEVAETGAADPAG